ncbi:MAG: glycosyltransferase family 2 protein, partial [Candidatus Shapirobacteria bacterium]|nr:glycosyltransferase family 2 protein [Candidatus Shapirobacteria bacterium]
MISIVVPVFNEEKSLKELYQRINKVLKGSWEIIFVDDGSTDNSATQILKIAEKDKRVILASLSRHLGKAKALMRGFQDSKGEVIVTLDADLQDEPEEIPKFLAKIDEGYDLVNGWKKQRRDFFLVVLFSR